MSNMPIGQGDFVLQGNFERPQQLEQESWAWTTAKVVGFIGLLGAVAYASYQYGAHQAAQAGGKIYEETVRNLMSYCEVPEANDGLVPYGAKISTLAEVFTQRVMEEIPSFDLGVTEFAQSKLNELAAPTLKQIGATVEDVTWYGTRGFLALVGAKAFHIIAKGARLFIRRPY